MNVIKIVKQTIFEDRKSVLAFLLFMAILTFSIAQGVFVRLTFPLIAIFISSTFLDYRIIFPFWKSILIQLALLPLLLLLLTVISTRGEPIYKGGYSPSGEYCDYGYNTGLKQCCDEDDYSCEVCDLHGIYCGYKDIFQYGYFDIDHIPSKVNKGDYDCSQFKSWDEAQKVFIRDGGPEKDPYWLDDDRDGKACENLIKI